jgi:Putative beta barrel porin-7 (BBP7)
MSAATLRCSALAALALASGTACAQSATPELTGPFTVGAEALIWWYKSSPTPVPVIISNGVVGRPETNVLLGGGNVDTNVNAGFRLFAGYAVNAQWGVEGDFFYLPQRSTSSSVSSSGADGSTDLLLPFYDVTRNHENFTEISFAPLYAGSAKVEFSNKLMGAEIMTVWAFSTATPWKVDLLGGFRWLQLKENYTITTSSPSIPPYPLDIWNTTDSFDASNNFYGAQFAARARYDQGPWVLNGVVKIGLGAMDQKVSVNGSLVTDEFAIGAATQTFPGGYFALPTNIGDHSRMVFAVVPEVKFNLGYRVTPATTVYVGYSFLYASNVARPGNQINRNINPTQSVSYVGDVPAILDGPAQPTFNFNSTSFWAQGVSIGLRVAF